jgi:hypothetical protein
MSRIGIAITKRVAFRDSTQEFSNIYHYEDGNPANPTNATALGLIDELAAFEKTIHSGAVTFRRGKCWSAGGTRAENQMLAEKNLAGVGTGSGSDYDAERAYLVMWRAGRNTKGKPVYLRKWYHTLGGFGAAAAVTLSAAVLNNSGGFTQANRDNIANKADEITRIGNLEGWGLVAESGRERDGGPPTAHRYLEHHQMGDQWRG